MHLILAVALLPVASPLTPTAVPWRGRDSHEAVRLPGHCGIIALRPARRQPGGGGGAGGGGGGGGGGGEGGCASPDPGTNGAWRIKRQTASELRADCAARCTQCARCNFYS
eukprot:scaffold30389_cov82-Phaeocystis_antarctica.AAC.2